MEAISVEEEKEKAEDAGKEEKRSGHFIAGGEGDARGYGKVGRRGK